MRPECANTFRVLGDFGIGPHSSDVRKWNLQAALESPQLVPTFHFNDHSLLCNGYFSHTQGEAAVSSSLSCRRCYEPVRCENGCEAEQRISADRSCSSQTLSLRPGRGSNATHRLCIGSGGRMEEAQCRVHAQPEIENCHRETPVPKSQRRR